MQWERQCVVTCVLYDIARAMILSRIITWSTNKMKMFNLYRFKYLYVWSFKAVLFKHFASMSNFIKVWPIIRRQQKSDRFLLHFIWIVELLYYDYIPYWFLIYKLSKSLTCTCLHMRVLGIPLGNCCWMPRGCSVILVL